MNRFVRSSILPFALCALGLAACGGDVASETNAPTPSPAPSRGENAPSGSPAPSTPESEPRTPQKVGEIDAPSNVAVPFHVYVSNQSFDLDPVDIDLFVDGKKVVTGDFRVEGQHTWIKFDFEIAVGEHQIQAVTKKGNVEVTESLKIPAGEHWAVVNFWFDASTPATFSINAMDTEPAFM